MGPRDRFYPYLYHCDYIGLLGTGFMQVFHLGRAPRTKETLPDFLKWRRVIRHPLVFCGLTGSQRTPGFRGVTAMAFNPANLSLEDLFLHWRQDMGTKQEEQCKTRENSNFMKNGEMVISVKIRNFSKSRMMKQTSSLESSREI